MTNLEIVMLSLNISQLLLILALYAMLMFLLAKK